MTTQEIIDNIFHLYTDDTTELSTAEEVALADRISKKIAMSRPWEILRTEKQGTLSISVPYVTLPDDFGFITENHDYTDNSISNDQNSASRVVFVGSTYRPYKIINFADRRQYRDQDGYAYIDIGNSRLYFTKQPVSAESYEYDYIKVPATLTSGATPWMPAQFQPIIGFGMAVDGFITQLFDKARSYAKENNDRFESYMLDMAFWNANLRQD